MDATRFDSLTRSLELLTRRRAAQGLLGAGLTALLTRAGPDDASAGKGKKKLKRKEYGCVDVGGTCRGKDKHCCSGRCQGKKPKKGAKDTSRCVAHDTGTIDNGERGCRAGDDGLDGFGTKCTTTAGEDAWCRRTTGDAGYCSASFACIPGSCRKDADCTAACGDGAACVVTAGSGCEGTGTSCMGTMVTATCQSD